jgi:hypothetical protein
MLYMAGGVAYVFYHASEVAQKIYEETKTDISFSTLSNPFWRWSPTARRVLESDPEFRRYLNRVETAKVAFMLGAFALFAINLLIA